MKLRLSRRHLLRGAALGGSAAIALPWLEAMVEQRAAAQAPTPKRLGVFFFGNGRGIEPDRWRPASTGPDWQLSPQLMPLEAHKPYLNVLTGMDVKTNSRRGHHQGTVAMLSGGEFVTQPKGTANFRSTFALPSIDQVAAAAFAGQTPFPSIEVALLGNLARGEGTTLFAIAHKGPDNVSEGEDDPSKLFDRLFGDANTGQMDETAMKLRLLRRSVLDTVAQDAAALGARVGTRDRVRIEQHLQTVRQIEQRLAGTEPTTGCSVPEAPQDVDGLQERSRVMSELIATAMACDLTRVFSILCVGSVANPRFASLTKGHHARSHDAAAGQSQMDRATIVIMEQFAILLNALESTPDVADSNLLDASGILCTSDTSNGTSHSSTDMPIVLAGAAGGALRSPGRHVNFDGANTSRALLTLMRAVGLELEQFGGGGGRVSEGVSEIEV